MKLTLPLTALAAILGLALAGAPVTVQAQTTTAPAPAAAPAKTSAKKSEKTPYNGTLTAVDASSITVSTSKKDPSKVLTITIAATTKFKGKAAITDFAVGDAVAGSYTKDAAGTLTAATLNYHPAKAPKASKPAAATPTTPAAPAAQ